MNDRTDGTTHDTTDRATRHDVVSVQDAAAIIGISPDSVRARLRRGSLRGEKQGTTWLVHIDASLPHEPGRDRATRHDTPRDATRHDTTSRDIDLAPLADLIERQTAELQRLAASNAMWQTRAAHLEQQLLALGAGNAPQEAPQGPPRADSEPTGIAAWLKRVLGK